jgi:hypothetical protein
MKEGAEGGENVKPTIFKELKPIRRVSLKLLHSLSKVASKYYSKMPWLKAPTTCGISRSSKSVMFTP